MSDRIEKEIALKAPVARVWRALTYYREFGEWFGVRIDGPFVLGEVSRGSKTSPGCENLKWQATIVAMEAEKRFAYRWHPYPADREADYATKPTTLVEFTLEAKGNGTVLRVTESGFDALAAAQRAEAFPMHETGWTMQMKNLVQHLGETVS